MLDLLTLPSLEIVASSSMDHTIRLWDMHTGKSRKTLTGHTKVRAAPCVTGVASERFTSRSSVAPPPVSTQGVRSLAYSPDYRFLISAGFDYDALVCTHA